MSYSIPTSHSTNSNNNTNAMQECQVVNGVSYYYLTGFGNELSSEVIADALPVGRNTPRRVPFGLYTEQLSGSAFTAPRANTRRTWLYRLQPSVAGTSTSTEMSSSKTILGTGTQHWDYLGSSKDSEELDPTTKAKEYSHSDVDPLRWKPLPVSKNAATDCEFWKSLVLQCHTGDPAIRQGLSIYQYAASNHFQAKHDFCNADGDFLIVPSFGTLLITTELGCLTVTPTEICVIPRGIVYTVASICDHHHATMIDHKEGITCKVRGYVLEIYSPEGFALPEMGPIGSNGLANARDFLYPVAACSFCTVQEYTIRPHIITTKQNSHLFSKTVDHSPYNVLAWHGNYLPYKYDLKRFCAVNSVTYDHLDPSLYTVLTCPSISTPGTALADFVIFPPRVMATDTNTLRPPWFHRNVMSEYMGLIQGSYDAKQDFVPGSSSLHNNMTPHGPDAVSYHKAVLDPCDEPLQYNGGLAFMFETYLSLSVTETAWTDPQWRDMTYIECWHGLTAENFSGWELLSKVKPKK